MRTRVKQNVDFLFRLQSAMVSDETEYVTSKAAGLHSCGCRGITYLEERAGLEKGKTRRGP